MTGTKRARHPQPLDVKPENWLQRVRSASSIGLFLDFDGTVSPIAETPLLAEIDPEIREIIGHLAAREDVHVSIVSGRSIDDVRTRAGVAGVIYAGNHGLEIESDTVCFREPQAESLRLELRALILQLELALSGTDGTLIEQKGLSASVHYRQVNEALREWVRHTVQQTVERSRSFSCRDGKMVVEVRPAIDWHKGHAVQWILDRVLPPGALPIYIGDDATDEDAFFLVADGITIRVGEAAESYAAYSAPDLDAVRNFLSKLGELRSNAEKGAQERT
jgi:trehalose 6-phosphate phosphatase